jgi:hypothetical protein
MILTKKAPQSRNLFLICSTLFFVTSHAELRCFDDEIVAVLFRCTCCFMHARMLVELRVRSKTIIETATTFHPA